MGGKVCTGRGTTPDDFDQQVEYLRSKFKLTDQQIVQYKAFFNDFSEHKKTIERENFRKVYQILYRNEDAAEFADRVFDAFDTNQSGSVDFVEFAAGLTMMDSKQTEQKISIAFNMFDKDGSNALSEEEVTDMITAYYKLLGPHISISPVEVAHELFEKMDLNSDQKVTYDEFTTTAKNDPKVLAILDPQV
ncbi:neuronal calcium sensor 2-like [Mytilus californianus]|uniref:neuronal calcium sensor 2-like n=1 Tax=Mytilus californianus TaxID=6549 RepID=UPI002247AFA9|nr:neuronal calcium sensor 2-like [Mytilus californianus]